MSSSALSISGYSYGSKTLLDLMDESDSEKTSSSKSNALSAYSSSSSSTSMSAIKQQVQSLLAGIDAGEDGKLTLSDIEAARDTLLDKFTSTIKGDLKTLGVDEDVEFTLGMNSSGDLVVSSSTADTEKIQAYLDANPDLADDYEDIQKLTKFTNLANSTTSVSALRSQIQSDHLDLLMNSDDSDWISQNSLLLNYSKGTVSTYAGLDITV